MDENEDLFSREGEIKFDCTIDKQKLKKLNIDFGRKYVFFSFEAGLSCIGRFFVEDPSEIKYTKNCIKTIIKQAEAYKDTNVLKVDRPNEVNNL